MIAIYETEGRIYAKYILQNIKSAKSAYFIRMTISAGTISEGCKTVSVIQRRA